MTGRPDGPAIPPSPGLVAGLDALVAEVATRTASLGRPVALEWEDVVCSRAERLGLTRGGRRSANGSCRLLRCRDGWASLNLPRPEDLASVGALSGAALPAGPGPEDEATRAHAWEAVEGLAPKVRSSALVSRARLLGMAAAPLGRVRHDRAPRPERLARISPPVTGRRIEGLAVVDLSAMWAGPLAAAVLMLAGASVTKVEAVGRPDGARAAPDFYRSLHGDGQPAVQADLRAAEGREALRRLLEAADVVIESSRPRALEQLGCGPGQLRARPGCVWLSITGYGRHRPGRDWVAFGDDASVAGGLVAREPGGGPVFLGDALADPLTGLVGAAAVLRALSAGGGLLVDVAMARCARALAAGG